MGVHRVGVALVAMLLARSGSAQGRARPCSRAVVAAEWPREAVMRRYDMNGFERDTEITELFFAIDPGLFAVKAWQHHQQPESGRVIFLRILGHVEPPR